MLPAPYIDQLSTEVLILIFIHCLSNSISQYSRQTGHRRPNSLPIVRGREAPLLLTYVCRRWKEVAEGTSDLWISFHLDIPETPYPDDVDWEWHHEMFQRWLSFTMGRPLTFCVAENDSWGAPVEDHSTFEEVPREDSPIFKEYLETLASHSQQWKDVTLDLRRGRVKEFECVDDIFLAENRLPILERFCYVEDRADQGWPLPTDHDEDVPNDLFIFLEDAPSLKVIKFHRIYHHNLIPPLTDLNLSQLKKISLESFGSFAPCRPYVRKVLGRCTGLESLYLGLEDSWTGSYSNMIHWLNADDVQTAAHPILLPNLRHLQLYVDQTQINGCDNMDIINMMTAPQLESLDLSMNEEQTLHHDALSHFLMRSGMPLVTLQLMWVSLSESFQGHSSNIISCLKYCPKLEHFKIWLPSHGGKGAIVAKPVIAALIHDDANSNPLCAELRQLTIDGTFQNGPRDTLQYLAPLIDSRSSPALRVRLQTINISSYNKPDNDIEGKWDDSEFEAAVKRWKDLGLNIVLNRDAI